MNTEPQYLFIYMVLEEISRRQSYINRILEHLKANDFSTFNKLALEKRNAVFGALYEVLGCPSGKPFNYGEIAFFDPEIPSAKKAEAVRRALSA